ncbi:MAG: HAD-IA family hydrolase [Bryobacteraceae bacterium]|nr:HAD-IA family hydrolase [Bryobacteraceae bacterium]
MAERIIVFDMDGVLVDVSESYRATIVETVKLFTGEVIARELIQEYKNQGGWNNDWLLSQKICADLGQRIPLDTVITRFNEIFFGDANTPGLMQRERWLPLPGMLERLHSRFDLGIFTGRLRFEAQLTLDRFAKTLPFAAIVGADDVEQQKPHPEGLLKIAALDRERPLLYVGDTVDDARASRAAGVPFVGVAADTHGHRAELVRLFESENAAHIIENINELEGIV